MNNFIRLIYTDILVSNAKLTIKDNKACVKYRTLGPYRPVAQTYQERFKKIINENFK